MTHAMAEVWRGNYMGALQYNALSITVFPIVCIYLLYRSVREELGKGEGFYVWEYVVLVVLFMITIGYAYIRNRI